MAKFFVGQRVRVVKVRKTFEDLGKEGVIVGWHSGVKCWEVSLNGIGEWSNACKDMWFGFYDEQLEPILDPGSTPSVFSYEELMDGLRSGKLVAP